MATANHDWLARDAGSIHFRHALVTDGDAVPKYGRVHGKNLGR
jgi:hypothetical protein